MEYRNLNLTVEEIDLIAEALDLVYHRKIKKAHLMSQPRSEKIIAELSFCQTLMQRLLATKNYDAEKTDAVIG